MLIELIKNDLVSVNIPLHADSKLFVERTEQKAYIQAACCVLTTAYMLYNAVFITACNLKSVYHGADVYLCINKLATMLLFGFFYKYFPVEHRAYGIFEK